MKTGIKVIALGCALLALSGCVEQQAPVGPEAYSAPSADGQTRLVIFRNNYLGFALQPKIHLDGQQVATCVPGTATSVTVAPGAHRLSGATLAEKSIVVNVAKGNTVYVSCSIGVGLIVGSMQLDVRVAEEAAAAIAKMKASKTE